MTSVGYTLAFSMPHKAISSNIISKTEIGTFAGSSKNSEAWRFTDEHSIHRW